MSRRSRPPRLATIDAGPPLAAPELARTWAAYRADPSDLQLRNRLVEHYLPEVHNLAASIALRMRLVDWEDAVGDVLAALVSCIVPEYDGHCDFMHWARVCLKRLLLSQRRRDRLIGSTFEALPTEPGRRTTFDSIPDRDPRSDEQDFMEITEGLSDFHAAMLWLKYRRGASFKAVARVFKMETPTTAKVATFRAIRILRKKFRQM